MARTTPHQITKNELYALEASTRLLYRYAERMDKEGLQKPVSSLSSSYADILESIHLVEKISRQVNELARKARVNHEIEMRALAAARD